MKHCNDIVSCHADSKYNVDILDLPLYAENEFFTLNINESEFDLDLPGISLAEIYHGKQLEYIPLTSSIEDEDKDNTEDQENEPAEDDIYLTQEEEQTILEDLIETHQTTEIS